MKEFVDTFGSIDAATGERIITSSTSSLVVSILSAGTFFGALSAGPLGDILGRRWGLIFAVFIVFNFGIILQMASSSIPLFVAGRFFAGFGVGMMSSLVPLYQVTFEEILFTVLCARAALYAMCTPADTNYPLSV